jgi:hypothetical protein
METKIHRPRLSVEITPEQQLALQKFLDHGMQKKLFNIIVDDVIRMLKQHGRNFLAAVIMHKLSYQDYGTLEIPNGKPAHPAPEVNSEDGQE